MHRAPLLPFALKNGKLSLVWSQDQTTLSFTTLPGPSGQRVLIGTDISFPKMSAGILVTPGYAGLQYFLAADGHTIALRVVPGS